MGERGSFNLSVCFSKAALQRPMHGIDMVAMVAERSKRAQQQQQLLRKRTSNSWSSGRASMERMRFSNSRAPSGPGRTGTLCVRPLNDTRMYGATCACTAQRVTVAP